MPTMVKAPDAQPRRGTLDDEERALWVEIPRSVRPLARNLAVPAAPPSRPIRPAPSAQAVHKAAPAPKPPPRLEPLDRRQKQRLARGVEPIDARLDLHRKTPGEAHAALLRVLRRAQA